MGDALCTAAGLDGSNTADVHSGGVRQELSAKADIAQSKPRIHSPWLGRREYRFRAATGNMRRGWGAAMPIQIRD
ncbi:hypothetical protein [Longimicrobium sp.]|uniref:hypothetical protein n=1 Tax=Longimicrobium sp. TaxID=2029185 RepID=UPI002E3017E2|nr:hypothetical protein [Longimicrobium sp.]HEX6040580.1 hypothetical protein [Longimicrobium sp.]